jgi:hypothetical protein
MAVAAVGSWNGLLSQELVGCQPRIAICCVTTPHILSCCFLFPPAQYQRLPEPACPSQLVSRWWSDNFELRPVYNCCGC